jgi:hypothetical protein
MYGVKVSRDGRLESRVRPTGIQRAGGTFFCRGANWGNGARAVDNSHTHTHTSLQTQSYSVFKIGY